MGRLFLITLEGNIYSCKHCKTHFALYEDIASKVNESRKVDRTKNNVNQFKVLKGIEILILMNSLERIRSSAFHCRHGKAYLFDKVVNVTLGEKEERMMMTGMHTVVDIFCVGCGSLVGWKYVRWLAHLFSVAAEAAFEKNQKYKEGKFILERFMVLGPDGSHYMANPEAQVAGSDADDA
ncbi:Yippee family putative zinc-binding protein [Actinidia rufa]|uniref:Yippee family putative zinc-binding protein n=1 Tax=Actinidia rufa TaxID=165716 RepID=A0A7J0EBC8_9ERIC|nr:Yippee family putative zinc-binding protein [Actinidia rufa]